MKEYYIYLPRNVKIDIFNLPEDFENTVKRTFKEFTEGTATDYQYCDKLAYIDRFVSKITKNDNADTAVNELVKERFEYAWEENREILSEDDVYCAEFMEHCYESGRDSQRLYQHYGLEDHHIYDQIQKVIVRVITVIMNYEGADND